MKKTHLMLVGACTLAFFACTQADKYPNKLVRVAKIEVDSAQLTQYQAALREGVETAVREEPGVLSLYAVADKSRPTHITVFEVYADTAAYKAHLQTAHFKKYKSTTQNMVKSLELTDVIPVASAAKTP